MTGVSGSSSIVTRPSASEFASHYAGYVARVPDGDIRDFLAAQGERLHERFAAIDEDHGDHRYAPGKWSVKEMLAHVNDTERIMSCRALRFARGDATPLPGFDEKRYAPEAGAGLRPVADLANEFRLVRAATLALLRSLPPEAWSRGGLAAEQAITVRGLAWVIAGHAEHHATLLRERYLD